MCLVLFSSNCNGGAVFVVVLVDGGGGGGPAAGIEILDDFVVNDGCD